MKTGLADPGEEDNSYKFVCAIGSGNSSTTLTTGFTAISLLGQNTATRNEWFPVGTRSTANLCVPLTITVTGGSSTGNAQTSY